MSFRVKLVGYFVLLALLPLVALFWGFRGIAASSETHLADARIQAGLRASVAAYGQELDIAERDATTLARNREFQVALASENRAELRRIIQDDPSLRFVTPSGFHFGLMPQYAADRQVDVVGPGGIVGTVVASVPLDSSLAAELQVRSGLEPGDQIVILRDRQVVAPFGITGSIKAPVGTSATVDLGGTRYRAAVGAVVADNLGASIGVLTPQARIDAANSSFTRRFGLALLVLLALLAVVAFVQGRSIIRTIRSLVHAANAIARGRLDERVPVRGGDELALLGRSFNDMADQLRERLDELEAERERLRDAFSRLGDALGATHDPEQLLRVMVETAVDATGAEGAILITKGGEVVEAGDPSRGDEALELPLTAADSLSFGTLVLYGDAFDAEARITATSLAAQAVVALDNARLHRIVERQALIDGLTGLANRRHCEDALATELVRSERFGGPVALVPADLDGFKAVNDRYGHPAGDAVLRAFADVLRETVREIDVAGRFGGEEFMLLLPGTDAVGAAFLAERVRASFEERTIVTPDGAAIRVTASFGVATAPPSEGVAGLISAADTALYEAKRSGKNRVETASEPLRRP